MLFNLFLKQFLNKLEHLSLIFVSPYLFFMKKAWVFLVVGMLVAWLLSLFLPKKIFFAENDEFFQKTLNEQISDTLTPPKPIKKDSLVKNIAVKDSLKNRVKPAKKKNQQQTLPTFFKNLHKLEKTKSGQVRIAYFGDSMQDGDMIIMQLRHYLQRKFGGKGVGFVPITSPSSKGRYTIKHSFSSNWHKASFIKKGYGKFYFGLNGNTFYVGDSVNTNTATVTYRRGNAYKELPLINPVLFYGRKNIDSVTNIIYQSKENTDTIKLKRNNILNKISLPNFKKKFTLTITDKGTTPYYGVSFASKTGVIVDNLAIRGNSGMALTKLNANLMRKFQKTMKYDLLIVHYGTNVFSKKITTYNWYAKRMKRVVRHLQNCFPNTDILVVSMADRAMKINETMQTPDNLPNFINTQNKIATASNTKFFNFFKAMGGKNSMVNWVEKDSLANKDYTHFNPKGAEKAGRIFYNWLIKEYENYKKTKPNE